MKSFKFFTLLLLGLLIFGSAGYFGYQLFIKPGRAERKEREAAAHGPAATPTPDPGQGEFQRLSSLQDSGKVAEARDGWRLWIDANPKSPLLPQARARLGTANMALLFLPEGGSSLITYTVIKGDSLARIAAKNHSNAELIQAANGLPGINLQIGQQLVIPALKISLELDRGAKTLQLLENGVFLKQYALLSAPPAPKKPETLNSKVLDKIAVSGTKRVAFGDKAYPQSERSILLTQSPAIVSAPAAAPDQTNAPTLPGGYVLAAEDLREVFPLVSRNTPAVIH